MTQQETDFMIVFRRKLKEIYAIDQEDLGMSDSEILKLHHGETPEELVRWFGNKYDLVELD